MEQLRELVGQELSEPVDPRVNTLAAAIADQHGAAARAVLFYGSCLRERQLDGLMLDFYLIVSDYRAAYRKTWLAVANRWIPPNVFPIEKDGLAAKYAVLSEADFRRECGPEARTVSVVARFAQPSRLVWVSDDTQQPAIIDSVARAAPTLLAWTLPGSGTDTTDELWKRAFSLTFGAELRAERSDRSALIVNTDPDRYERVGLAALQVIAGRRGVGPNGEVPLGMTDDQAARWWRRMQRRGKRASVLRLAKASVTFAGGVDYIAWKINRHADARIEIKPWQRRWPLIAAISLLPRLLKSGAIR
ncbi:MAG: hypothetical protein ABIO43_07735 [Sphingomicrobium sp.]